MPDSERQMITEVVDYTDGRGASVRPINETHPVPVADEAPPETEEQRNKRIARELEAAP